MKKRANRRYGSFPATGLLPGYALAIRRLRKQCKLTHRKLGRLLKVRHSAISFWENGLRRPSWRNFYALKRFAEARGLREVSGAFDLELERLAIAAQAKWLLPVVKRRARAGDKYARHLLEASAEPVRDVAKQLAARQFNLLIEAGPGFLDIDPPRYGMRLGYPAPRRVPAGSKRVWFMLTALRKEGIEVLALRRARKLAKPGDDALMGKVFQQTLWKLWDKAGALGPEVLTKLQGVKPVVREPLECPPQMIVRLSPEAVSQAGQGKEKQ